MRTYHVLDLENLACGELLDGHDCSRVLAAYDEAVGRSVIDLTVAATSNVHYERVAFELPTDIRIVPAGGGLDAADDCLLDLVDPGFVARRFERVVIGSGDGTFAELAVRLRRYGCEVWVVAYSWTLSSRLARAADRTIELDRVHGPAPLAA
jgi:hypothetical protein